MLINKPIDDTDYCAYRGGSFTEQFIKCRHGFGYEKLEKVSDIAKENLKNLPPEIEKDFKYYRKDKSCYEPKDSVGFKGRIYLLVDGDVFSSSEKFAAFAKSTGFATLAGEKQVEMALGMILHYVFFLTAVMFSALLRRWDLLRMELAILNIRQNPI